jgi:hypothetical protein
MENRNTIWIPLLLRLSFCGIILVISSRILLPFSYYSLTLTVSLTLAIWIIYWPNYNRFALYFSLIFLFFLLSNLYNITNDFRIIPLYDSYHEYAVTKLFMVEDRIYHVTTTLSDNPSLWPLGSALVMIFSKTTNIDILQSFLLYPSFYGLAILLSVVLFVRVYSEHSLERILPLAILMLAISPDVVYYRMIPYHRFLGLSLFYLSFYLVTKTLEYGRATPTTALLLLLSVGISLSHAEITFAYVVFLFSIGVLAVTGGSLYKKYVLPNLMMLTLVAFIVSYLWNGVVTGALTPLAKYIFEKFFPLSAWQTEAYFPQYAIPEALSSPLMVALLRLRDFMTYLPAFIAYITFLSETLLRRRGDGLSIIYLSLALAIPIFRLWTIGFRLFGTVAFYATPLIIYFAARFFASAYSTRMRRVLYILPLTFMIFMAFLSPWSHQYLTRFIYDPSVAPIDVGMHNPQSSRISQFIRKYIDLKGSIVFSDDSLIPFLILQPKDYPSLRYYWLEKDILGRSNSFILEFIRFENVLGGSISIPRAIVETTYDKVLDGGIYAIHYKNSHGDG